jgi:hypothetical protein
MVIRIKRSDNKCQKTQTVEPKEIAAARCDDSTACYEGQESVFRMFGGST